MKTWCRFYIDGAANVHRVHMYLITGQIMYHTSGLREHCQFSAFMTNEQAIEIEAFLETL